ncbi:MAG: AAA family ATPase [Nanoarchaeota archaeon]|nr:AAA family ATPase [Nanoarchaeota archaeon]
MYGYTTNISSLEEENRILRNTIEHLKNEMAKFHTPPFLICEVRDLIDDKAILSLKNGNEFFVNISSNVNKLKPGDFVLAHQKNLVIVDKVHSMKKFNVEKFVIIDKPIVSWKDIGGLAAEREEIKEVIELPLLKPELFEKVGIKPPKGILLHGPPGTGKTLLAKAVAASTNSTFIEIVGSELVQKFIGEGAKLVREIFELAREKAPSIVFIDELDALASQRMDIGTSGEREVQRTFMQLLAELDGFKELGNVKIIAATNRRDILDPAVIRPGRLDRQIYIDLPDTKGLQQIFKIHTRDMSLKKVNRNTIIHEMEGLSGAEVRAICTEAGYFAIREDRSHVVHDDFISAVEKVKDKTKEDATDFVKMFG